MMITYDRFVAELPALRRRRRASVPVPDPGALVCRPGRSGWSLDDPHGARRRGVGYVRADTWTLTRRAYALAGAARSLGIDVIEVYRDPHGARYQPGIPALMAAVRERRPEVLVVPSLEVLAWGQPWGDAVTVVRVLAQQHGCEVVDLAWDTP